MSLTAMLLIWIVAGLALLLDNLEFYREQIHSHQSLVDRAHRPAPARRADYSAGPDAA